MLVVSLRRLENVNAKHFDKMIYPYAHFYPTVLSTLKDSLRNTQWSNSLNGTVT